MSEDKRRDIENELLPYQVIPTEECLMLFGLIEAIYTLDYNSKVYLFKEGSGVIRNGFTVEFYNKYPQYFTTKNKESNLWER